MLLSFAIVFEVFATMLLPVSQNFTRLIPSFIMLISYGISFYFLSIVSQQLPLALIYASWAGMGIFLVTVLSYFLYKQVLNWQIILGLCFIIVGICLIHLFKR